MIYKILVDFDDMTDEKVSDKMLSDGISEDIWNRIVLCEIMEEMNVIENKGE